MKNSDLPCVKKLLSDDYDQEFSQSYEMLEHLAKEQKFTFEFIQWPTNNKGLFLILLTKHFNCLLIFLF